MRNGFQDYQKTSVGKELMKDTVKAARSLALPEELSNRDRELP
jgi:hypothetical protein